MGAQASRLQINYQLTVFEMKWSYILFLPAAVSIFCALFTVLLKKQLIRYQLLQSLTFLLEGAAMIVLAIFFRGRAGSLFIYDFLFETLSLLCAPMYYIGICSLTEPRGATLHQRRVFSIPLLFTLGLTIGAFVLGPRRYEILCYAIREGDVTFIPGDSAWNFMLFWDHWLYPAVFLILSCILVVMSSRKTILYQRRFNSYYAENLNAPKIDTRWVTVLSWIFFPLALIAILTVDFRPPYFKYILIAVAVLFAVVQYLSGRFCYHMDYDARYLADLVKQKINKQ